MAATPLRQLLRSKSGSLWEVCIGLEVHAQVLSRSKLMSGSPASLSSAAQPNRNVSFFDAALPGTLPVVNRECVHQAIRTSLAVGATVHSRSIFERKHYFYCDLPLGYQLTQQRAPIATDGVLQFDLPAAAVVNEAELEQDDGVDAVFDGSKYKNRKEKNEALRKWKEKQQAKKAVNAEGIFPRHVRIARIQIEQDSGKSNHEMEENATLVDLNRAGTALMEIVMEPDLRSPVEAGQVIKQLQHLLRHLEVCDGNMEEGSMRCDLNVSVRPAVGEVETPFGERVEVKNMNSIRNMMRAAEYEARRQIDHIEQTGVRVERETRSFDAVSGETKRMRSKEGAKDYRFFPEPDLPPLVVDATVIDTIRELLPELPSALKERLSATYGLTSYESSVLVNEGGTAAFFEEVARKSTRPPKLAVNWILNELFSHLKATNTEITDSPVNAVALGELVDLLVDGTISGKIAKDVLEIMYYENLQGSPTTAIAIVDKNNWKQIQDEDAIRELCLAVLNDPKTQKNLVAYRNGKTQLFGFFIGQVMKACDGRVHPELANSIMLRLLEQQESDLGLRIASFSCHVALVQLRSPTEALLYEAKSYAPMSSTVRNTAIKRIQGDVREMMKDPSDQYYAAPLEDNMFDWHFTLRGPRDTEFEGGIYHGRILLPSDYPFKPPNIMLLTPNGRFEVRKKICLSISAYHPEEWQPAWGIRLILEALISFMPTKGEGAIGALDYPPQERRRLAKLSCDFKCDLCGKAVDLLPDLKRDGEGETKPSKYADQIAQLHLHGLEAAAPSADATPSAAEREAEGKATPADAMEEKAHVPDTKAAPPAPIIGEAVAYTRDETTGVETEVVLPQAETPPTEPAATPGPAPPPAPVRRPEPIYAAPLPPQPRVPVTRAPDHVDSVLHYVTITLTVALFALVYKKMLQMQGVLQ